MANKIETSSKNIKPRINLNHNMDVTDHPCIAVYPSFKSKLLRINTVTECSTPVHKTYQKLIFLFLKNPSWGIQLFIFLFYNLPGPLKFHLQSNDRAWNCRQYSCKSKRLSPFCEYNKFVSGNFKTISLKWKKSLICDTSVQINFVTDIFCFATKLSLLVAKLQPSTFLYLRPEWLILFLTLWWKYCKHSCICCTRR